jgi:hypothetical protein
MNMSTLSLLDLAGLWISIPMICIGAALLPTCILKTVKLVKRAKLFSVPFVAEQEVEFTEAGRVVLCGEGPWLTSRFAFLRPELQGADGNLVPGRTAWFRAKTTSFSKVRMELKLFNIPKPGRYLLRIEQLKATQPADAEHAIVFMRPHLAQSVGYVIGMILAFALFAGGIVLLGLTIT